MPTSGTYRGLLAMPVLVDVFRTVIRFGKRVQVPSFAEIFWQEKVEQLFFEVEEEKS